MSEELKQHLSRHLLFARLTPAQLDRAAQRARLLRLDEGQPLFAQGDPADRFFYVVSGQIKLSRLSPEGNEKVIDIVSAGNTFAEALMFLEGPAYPVNATALGPCELVSIDSRDFAAMLRDSIDTCFLLMGDMSQRLRGLIAEIDNLSLQSGTCRVASYLLKMAPEDQDEFRLDIPKGVMASRLSVKPETFSRILRNLQDSGILSIRGAQVTIHDRDALEDRAEGLT
ncbi:transcriptional regulator [Thiohalobacter sp. COW1]|uniref:Crp/Fnr family transcriptional regulator n=1 Tax=Thiohalobacter sp. COW1 TaxID=2795687 RepID=UPI00191674F0|nr:Crp/Fnr family transcriptional regulator [Thiohalobacter sp. COW1]BCO32165.1 transcriptional regulator [Thiohalobacter sp. COW1]